MLNRSLLGLYIGKLFGGNIDTNKLCKCEDTMHTLDDTYLRRIAIYMKLYIICIVCVLAMQLSMQFLVASVPGLPRYAVLLASVNCARAGHTENGEGMG